MRYIEPFTVKFQKMSSKYIAKKRKIFAIFGHRKCRTDKSITNHENRITLFFVLLMISTSIYAQKVMRIGIIGLDTSHSTAFTELINSGSDETFSKGFRVVAAYPYGSKTIQSSYERIPGYIEK